jgi:hypothetical protein
MVQFPDEIEAHGFQVCLPEVGRRTDLEKAALDAVDEWRVGVFRIFVQMPNLLLVGSALDEVVALQSEVVLLLVDLVPELVK